MDMSQVTTVELHGAGSSSGGSGHRRRPPKLKSVDRTVSMIVDNYTPLTSAALSAKNAGPLVINMDEPLPSSRRSSPNINADDLFRGHTQSSNSMENAIICDDDYPHPPSSAGMRKSSSFRRGETIDMMDLPSTMSTSLQHLRKTPSFHSPIDADDETIQIVPLSRHYSVRHHTHPTTPSTFKSFVHQAYQQQLQQQQEHSRGVNASSSSSTRRNCSMHRSFHEPQKRTTHTKREPAVKSNSFSSDDNQPPVQLMYQQQQHSSMQFPAKRNSSIESDMYRSRSNSRSNSQVLDEQQQSQFLDVWKPSPMPSPQPGHSRKSPSPRPSSSNSLDQVLNQQQQQQQQTASRVTAKMLRHQHTIAALNPQFLAPIPLLALDKSFENVYQVKSPVFDMKKSYSLKYKNGPSGERSSKESRELFKSRKSKSFITDNEPLDVPFTLSPSLSPAALSASGSVKKHHSPMISPLPQARNKMLLEDMKRRSGDGADLLPQDPTSFPIEFGGLDFNTIYKSYRAQQKSTTSGRRHKNRRKKSSSSIKNEDDFETESLTKRKKIVCIVMVVFCILVVLSVLAVIVTLTHASVAQVQNQTRHVYTFSHNREQRPIHYPAGGGGGN
jgi:hypothetical protein